MEILERSTDLIGNTPLIRLGCVSPNVVAKLEQFNPLSSIKDRPAYYMVEDGIKRGEIDDETTIIEATSGNTGIGLASVCAAKDIDLVIALPENVSEERKKLLKAFNVEIKLTSEEKGMEGAIEEAKKLNEEIDNSYWTRQFENPANPKAHEETTGKEIWEQTNGQIDIFIAGVGTGGTLTGVTRYIKKHDCKQNFKAIGVEPNKSPVISGNRAGSHGIEGIGPGFVPKNLDTDLIDGMVRVKEEDAKNMANRLAKNQGILPGISSGANLYAADKIAKKQQKSKLIVTVIPDTGERYLSTNLFD
ncbi:MAG: Cysteine synthase CysK [Candidatus Methanohalarchaeum thermophilum]|uniref:Cysteine synthase CysK n=1 Tax=Methanohalarchaeum thermophilum TaxID=1903181 RepID=A0A1Q6DSI8_METT1|nr:MAG: Cysteine synthase CysK [Candidatus Methanohalarchaeum thermophilum]